jgi:leucyl aminopeptidase (aminopeptidase T)
MSVVAGNYSKFTSIITGQLQVRRRDQVLIVTDTGHPGRRIAPLMAGCYLLAAKRLGLTTRVIMQEPKTPKMKVDERLQQALRNLGEDNFIMATASEKLGSFQDLGSSFKRMTNRKRHRFVLTTLLQELATKDYKSLISAMDIDYPKLQERAKRLKSLLDYGREVTVVTDKGTHLYFNISGMKAYVNDGKELTSGGNVPVGEVFIAPKKNCVEGTVVIDGSVRHRTGTVLVRKNVTIRISNGEVQRIEGGDEASLLRDSITAILRRAGNTWGIKRIGELGIGLNPGAKVCGPNIINEKALHTAHIAIGSNATFGGTIYAPLHLDQVFHNPRFFIDGKEIRLA